MRQTVDWEEMVREDHENLEDQLEVLAGIFRLDALPEERWAALRWTLRTIRPMLEAHFKKEEGTLFPALEKALGVRAAAIPLLVEQHGQLKAQLDRMEDLLFQRPARWDELKAEGIRFTELLGGHEKTEQRLLVDFLGPRGPH